MSATFASVELRTLFKQRMGQLCGIGVALAALAMLVALVSYNPHDPSLNTATSLPATNLAGAPGAMLADVSVQYFGAAGVLPVLALLAWAYRVGTSRPLRLGVRLISLLLALPILGAVLAAAPTPGGLAGLSFGAGLGGAVGLTVSDYASSMGRAALGPMGGLIMFGAEALLAVLLVLLTLGLTGGEWRAAGMGAVGVARGSVRGGRGAAGLMSRTATQAAGVARAVAAPVRRALEPWPEADLPPLPADPRVGRANIGPADDDDDAGDEDLRPAMPRAPEAPAYAGAKPKVAMPAKKPPPLRQQSLPLIENGWQFPPLDLLTPPPRRADAGPSEDALQANARLLESVLNDYGVQGTIREIRPGPVVTLYELEPAPGIRSARVIGLADDVARSLSVTAVRIATVPGRNVIGIEVPNAKRETVFLSELLGSGDWASHPGKLALALGKDISGAPVVADLARMPHLLIAGTTGSGKSVGINAMILSILYRLSPDQCRLIMIDPKMLELSVYEGIPHLLAPVVTEPAKAVTALKWTTREMERRYRAMSQLGVRNVGGYNETGFDSETGKPVFEEQPLALKPLPYIVVVIDEMADLMMVAGKEVEAAVQRLAQMARAAGIHVIMATQRPSVDVITGTIKANFPTRISFQVISKFDSRTILGEQGAEQLLGMGDLLHMAGGGRIARVHGPFVTDREVEDVVAFLRGQAEPTYDDEVTEGSDEDADGAQPGLSGIAGASDGEKGLFDQAVDLVTREGKASTSFIQRHLSIGYNRAAKLIEQMEKEGVVSGANHVGKREVLARRQRDED
jgi:S-DNA-T family DNA segregation ATPase FtsK/SpoIIIE